jgi:hypothetical protein
LQLLSCGNNALTTLDVSELNTLHGLACSDNALTALDLSDLIELQSLACSNNALTVLDVSGLIALQMLSCSNNSLTALDVSKLTVLRQLNCDNNALTALDVSEVNRLKEFHCSNNALTALDVSGLNNLEWLYCENNRLTNGTLNITGSGLIHLYCRYNDMTPVAVPDASSITGYVSGSNPSYTMSYNPQNAAGFRPVADITGIPRNIASGTSFDLSTVAQVLPTDATNRTVEWEIATVGTTGATVVGNTLTTTATGEFKLIATIKDGTASGADYTEYFTINAVSSITHSRVDLPSDFQTNPVSGSYYVNSGDDFIFYLPVEAVPSGQTPNVTTGRDTDTQGGVVITLRDNGRYEIRIRAIRQDIVVSISFIVGNESVPTAKVWSSGGTLYITSTVAGKAHIYNVVGVPLKILSCIAGETIQTTLTGGLYIVALEGKSWKVVIRD